MPVRYGISKWIKGVLTVNVQVVLRKHFRTSINRYTGAIKYPPEHILRNRQLHRAPRELDMGSFDIDARGAFEDLYNGLLACDFEYLAPPLRSVRERERDDFVVGREEDVVKDYEGALRVDLDNVC